MLREAEKQLLPPVTARAVSLEGGREPFLQKAAEFMCAAQSAATKRHSLSSVFQVAAQVMLVAKSLSIRLHHRLSRILLLQKPYSTFPAIAALRL